MTVGYLNSHGGTASRKRSWWDLNWPDGQELFDALQHARLASVNREQERGSVSFASRRKAIERVGLPEVRRYRLARCDAEETEWRHELQSAWQVMPEIRPLLVLRVMKGGTG